MKHLLDKNTAHTAFAPCMSSWSILSYEDKVQATEQRLGAKQSPQSFCQAQCTLDAWVPMVLQTNKGWMEHQKRH